MIDEKHFIPPFLVELREWSHHLPSLSKCRRDLLHTKAEKCPCLVYLGREENDGDDIENPTSRKLIL